MLTLCGFAASNYYNLVKLALLEKAVPFEERLVWLEDVDRSASPLGKVPYLLTPQGAVSESVPMLEYIEAIHPQPALLPADAYAAAKVRELVRHMELHLELVARALYPQALFGGRVSDEVQQTAARLLKKNVPAFARLADFSRPFLVGDALSWADCAAIVHLPLISSATRAIYGQDALAELQAQDYLARMAQRPHVQALNAQRKRNAERLLARYSAGH
ncbi:glutathione S-transferase [Vandammella animalimorsus]|uniref:Glutathione S-transferase n=1 Tax=Vandammella animalimorsus TaxID=2029117 RepID=A0A2A2AVG2_9BURK|nr:glutathione S-transferase [Vandammella animalimorsus]PAT41733.1 glutathione S-transferase [Vandammella animalimorsus]